MYFRILNDNYFESIISESTVKYTHIHGLDWNQISIAVCLYGTGISSL